MTIEHTNLYTKYCRANDAVFELISSIRDLDKTNLDVNLTLSDIDDIVSDKLNELENAEK